MLLIDECRRERRIRRVLRAVARQRVGLILQPGNVWVMERAVSEDDKGTAEASNVPSNKRAGAGWRRLAVDDPLPRELR